MAEVQVEEPSAAAGSVFVRGRRWWRALSWPRRACFLAICVLGSWMLVKAAKMALLIGFVLTLPEPLQVRAFDAKEWNAPGWRDVRVDSEGLHTIRQAMVDDLLARKLLDGLSKADARELLGQPDAEHDTGWEFHLGWGRGLTAMEGEALGIRFDAAGRVTDAGLQKY